MEISEDLLNPIPGDNPSGQNLRYVLYSTINDARREDDEAPQGDWTYERKKADYPQVWRLCSDALAKQSKDLQLAVWATEAALKLQGLAGLQSSLLLLAQLVDRYWETIYPELEEGDAELRVAVLESLGAGKFVRHLLFLPLTRDGLTWHQCKDSRTIGYESDADSDEKKRVREEALSDDRPTAEIFDAAVSKTPKAFFEEQVGQVDNCLAALEGLNAVCQAHFGSNAPSFAGLRDQLDDFRQVVSVLLRKKREEEPEAASAQQNIAVEANEPSAEAHAAGFSVAGTGAAAAPARAPVTSTLSREPEDRADALQRIAAAAHFLRRQAPESPVPYLVLRALRWGELRESSDLDASLLEAPSTDLRKQLRTLQQDGDSEQLLNACEEAMAGPCGRGWLDLQRYAVRACDNLGHSAVRDAIVSSLKGLLADFPQLLECNLNDDTAAANPETREWLRELTRPVEKDEMRDFGAPEPEQTNGEALGQPPDVYALAQQAAASGRTQDAIALLQAEAAQERCGRGRFRRRVQLAQMCMAAGHKNVALPILESLIREIDDRKLEDWEDPDLLMHALGLLYQCLEKMKSQSEQREQIYARICRLGPAQALELGN